MNFTFFKKIPMLAYIIASVVVIAILGSGAALAYAITVKHSSSAIVRSIAKTFPIPAAKIGNRTVLYRDFLKSRDTVQLFLKSPAAKDQNITVPSANALDKNILEKLLNQDALEELAAQKNVTVTDTELRQFFSDVVSVASSTTPDVGVYLLQNFGWNEEDFRQNVLRPALLEQRLTDQMAKEQEGNSQALQTYLDARLQKDDVVRYLTF